MIRSTWISMTAVLAVGVLAGCGDDTTATTSDATTSGTGGTTSSSSSSSSSTGGSGGNGGSGGGAPDCGDGDVTPPEGCDDANAVAGDGCDAACVVEAGFSCTGMPSVCTTDCGDGVTAGDEECDDGNTDAGDGCDASCVIETVVCGNGLIDGADGCDDGNTNAGDGCDASCAVEPGYVCVDEPSVCTTECGDGIILGNEQCDDGDLSADDGCSPGCTVENGFVCNGEPSMCATDCGDGILAGLEECDDSNSTSGDGCDGVTCAVEDGYVCANIPSVCVGECGDNVIVAGEECDDGNTMDGDGCSSACIVEVTLESEPNDTSATANGPFSPDTGLIGATIGVIGDQDFFAINIPATADLRIETFDTSGPSTCAGAIDTVVELLAPDGTTSVITRDQGGVNNCSRIDSALEADAAARHLAPGIYFVRVEDYLNNGTIPGYTLYVTYNALCGDGVVEGAEECEPGGAIPCGATCDRVQACGDGFIDAPEECDDGNTMDGDGCSSMCVFEPQLTESEPNNTFMTADYVLPSAIPAAITIVNDDDFFAVAVPGPASVLTATITAGVVNTCGSDTNPAPPAIDSEIQILGTNGTTSLATNDDISGTLNWCSSAQATGLAAGIYYVRAASSGTFCSACTFDYTLNITVN